MTSNFNLFEEDKMSEDNKSTLARLSEPISDDFSFKIVLEKTDEAEAELDAPTHEQELLLYEELSKRFWIRRKFQSRVKPFGPEVIYRRIIRG